MPALTAPARSFETDEDGEIIYPVDNGEQLMETQRQIARRAEQEAGGAARLAAKLRELGIDPDSL